MVEKLKRIIGVFLLSGIFIFNILDFSLAQTVTQIIYPDHLKFKIVALDAQTSGAITQGTTSVNFGVIVTNDSPNNYGQVIVAPTSLIVSNYPQNVFTVTAVKNDLAAPELGWGTPFTSHLNVVSESSLNLGPVTTKYSIKATIKLLVTLCASPTTACEPNAKGATNYNTVVEDIIYTPSNSDLIPMIFNSLNNVNTAIQSFWSKLTTIQDGENYIVNQEIKTQSGENYIVNQENQIEKGENYIVNQESQIETGENYIVNQENQIEKGENYIVNQDSQIETGESLILNKIK